MSGTTRTIAMKYRYRRTEKIQAFYRLISHRDDSFVLTLVFTFRWLLIVSPRAFNPETNYCITNNH